MFGLIFIELVELIGHSTIPCHLLLYCLDVPTNDGFVFLVLIIELIVVGFDFILHGLNHSIGGFFFLFARVESLGGGAWCRGLDFVKESVEVT